MKNILTVTLALVLALSVCACTAEPTDAPAVPTDVASGTAADTAQADSDADTAADTAEAETGAATEADGSQGGTGGDDSYIFYAGKYRRGFYGIPIELDVLLGENGSETVDQWLNEEYNFSAARRANGRSCSP